ncbi:MAG: aminomethyl-transferring glycine dehydrogenase subunit GcvPA [Anaerolineaceae bacterium]|nr:aminomethyl-transferring glycine dehydrogenase subunit GcvPA [Anaerolineaceae bacterium]
MFTPHTENERQDMLHTIGVSNLEDLFQDVPAKYRFPNLDLPPAMTEMEALDNLNYLAGANDTTHDLACFLGAGAYNHYIPAAVDNLLQRGEFYSAYTPYQPEISQGTLQAIFEYQSLIAALTGMDVSNASHYDGATAAAEAGVMALNQFRFKRTKIIVSPAVNPQYRQTLRTYLNGYKNVQIVGDEPGSNPLEDPNDLANLLDDNSALLLLQYPDFFGCVYDYAQLIEKAHATGALVAIAANPTALAILKSPGEYDADIVVGEGQPLGIPLSFGGPYLGIFATKKKYVRKIAGRLVGETTDAEGRRGYVLTLTAREQHIRRERATSNICTNQGLMMLASTIYLSLLGKQGFRQVANLCYQKAHYAAQEIAKIPGFSVETSQPFFHEFIVKCPLPVEDLNLHLLDHGILGGYNLGSDYPSLRGHMLISVTEMNSRDEIDVLCQVLKEGNHD